MPALPEISLYVFTSLFSLPLVYSDLKSLSVKALPLGLLALLLVTILWVSNPVDMVWRILVSGSVLIVGGFLWVLSGENFGLGDVIYISLLALAQDPVSLYFTVLTACVAGFLFYGYYLLKYHEVRGIPLPFIPLLYLAFQFIEVPRWLKLYS